MRNARIEKRLAWIEAALRAGGKFPGKVYQKAFGISPQTMSDDLDEFAIRMQEEGVSCKRIHGGVVVDLPALPIFSQIDPREWTRDVAPGSVVNLIAPRLAEVNESLLKTVLEAIRDRVVVRCDYVSLSSGHRRAVLSPCVLVSAVGREHVRAFDHDKNEFRDYALLRMKNVSFARDIAYIGCERDEDWHRLVNVTLRPAKGITKKERQAVLLGLDANEKGEVSFQCKAALVNYTIQSLGLKPEHYVDQIDVEVSSVLQ